jgi:hypothetical protein
MENLRQDRQTEILTQDLRNIKQRCHTPYRYVRVNPKRQIRFSSNVGYMQLVITNVP